MKTAVFTALIALATTLFFVGCSTATIGTAGHPNTQILQVNTSDANAPTIPATCLAFQQQLVMLHQLVQAAKMDQRELQAQRDAAQAQQVQMGARLQQCISTTTTISTASDANCTSLQGQLERLQDDARFIRYDLRDVVLNQSETKARQARLAAVQVQITDIQEKLLNCANTPT